MKTYVVLAICLVVTAALLVGCSTDQSAVESTPSVMPTDIASADLAATAAHFPAQNDTMPHFTFTNGVYDPTIGEVVIPKGGSRTCTTYTPVTFIDMGNGVLQVTWAGVTYFAVGDDVIAANDDTDGWVTANELGHWGMKYEDGFWTVDEVGACP